MKHDSITDRTSISSSVSHRRVQRSTTLNRKYVKKPSKVASADSAAKRRTDDLRRRQALADKINHDRLAALKAAKTQKAAASGSIQVNRASSATSPAKAPAAKPVEPVAKKGAWYAESQSPKPLAATIEKNIAPAATDSADKKSTRVKDSVAKSALRSVASMKSFSSATSSISAKHAFGAKKLLLAFGCAALVVGVIGFFISTNTPDISVRVAAMQTGIDAAYPTYIPRGYSLSGIVSEDKKITMTFDASGNDSFVLSEEKSSWDNETLEASFAKSTWGNNYISVREQGITIFISGSDAAWINGSILYKIDASGNNLTKKQIKSIATSL